MDVIKEVIENCKELGLEVHAAAGMSDSHPCIVFMESKNPEYPLIMIPDEYIKAALDNEEYGIDGVKFIMNNIRIKLKL